MNLFKVLTIILLIFIPLYPKFPLQEVGGTYVAIRIDDFVVAAAIFLWLIFQAKSRFPILKERIFKLFALYWLVGLIVNLNSLSSFGLTSFKLAMFHWLRRVEYMSLFFVAKSAIKKRSDLKESIFAIWLTLAGVFIFGMGQKYWSWPVISTMNEEFSKGILLRMTKWTRISATFAGHYDLAAWAAMILCLTPAALAFSKKWWQKLLTLSLSLCTFRLLILTASRISFVAYLVGISTTLILLRKYWWIFPVVVGSLFFAFQSKELNARLTASLKVLPKISQKLPRQISFLKKKGVKSLKAEPTLTPTPTLVVSEKPLAPIEAAKLKKEKPKRKEKIIRTWPSPEEAEVAAARSSNIRFKVEWPRAIRAFLKNPLLGTGYSSLGLATDNDYLRILGETGILGGLTFMLIIFHLFRNGLLAVLARKSEWQLISGLLGAMIAFLANAIFIDVFEASKTAFYFWMLMGMGYKNKQINKFQINKSISK